MKGRDIIITGLQPWDIPIGSNAIDIAREMAVENRVLYVNSALDQMTIYRNKPTPEVKQRLEVLRKQKSPLRMVQENLWVLDFPFWVWSINGLPDGFLFDVFNRLNNKKIFGYIRKVADELNFKDIVHFIDNDIYRSFYSKEILKPACSVYYRRDNLPPYGYWKKHAVRLEPLLIEKSDVVVCNSPQYAEHAAILTREVSILARVSICRLTILRLNSRSHPKLNPSPRHVSGISAISTACASIPTCFMNLPKANHPIHL